MIDERKSGSQASTRAACRKMEWPRALPPAPMGEGSEGARRKSDAGGLPVKAVPPQPVPAKAGRQGDHAVVEGHPDPMCRASCFTRRPWRKGETRRGRRIPGRDDGRFGDLA